MEGGVFTPRNSIGASANFAAIIGRGVGKNKILPVSCVNSEAFGVSY
jgi:hypothetical protein